MFPFILIHIAFLIQIFSFFAKVLLLIPKNMANELSEKLNLLVHMVTINRTKRPFLETTKDLFDIFELYF